MTKTMACYVKIRHNVDSAVLVEVPSENNGTLLLSTVSAQFPDAIGLRFKNESGDWGDVKVEGNIMYSPLEGWGDTEYYVFTKRPLKRGAHNLGVVSTGESGKMLDKIKQAKDDILMDLVMAGLPHTATDEEVRTHFERFGELDSFEVKKGRKGTSRGFGFLRYKTVEAVEAAFRETHIINDKVCEVRYSKRSKSHQEDTNRIPTKIFVARLPKGTTELDVNKYFSRFGIVNDVFISFPFRGFGFVTFASQTAANKVCTEKLKMKGSLLAISLARPHSEKKPDGLSGQPNQGSGSMQGGMQANVQKTDINSQPWMQGNLQSNHSGIMSNYYGQSVTPNSYSSFGMYGYGNVLGTSPGASWPSASNGNSSTMCGFGNGIFGSYPNTWNYYGSTATVTNTSSVGGATDGNR